MRRDGINIDARLPFDTKAPGRQDSRVHATRHSDDPVTHMYHWDGPESGAVHRFRFESPVWDVVHRVLCNARVCPVPRRWDELWRITGGPLPLILAAWHETTPFQKRARVVEQLLAAQNAGKLSMAEAFLASLAPGDWVEFDRRAVPSYRPPCQDSPSD